MALAEATVRVVLDASRFERDLRERVERAANTAGRNFDRVLRQQMASTARTASREFANATRDGMLRAGRNSSTAFDAAFRQGIGQLAGRVGQRLGQGLRVSVSRAGLDAGRGFAQNVSTALSDSGTDAGRRFADAFTTGLATRVSRAGRVAGDGVQQGAVTGARQAGRQAAREFAISFDVGIGSARLGAPLVAALGSVAAAIASDLAPATGILAAVPSLLAAIGAGAGIAATAVLGISDAVEAINTGDIDELHASMQRLAPAAQAVVREFAAIRPELQALQQDIQNTFFSQLQGQVTGISQALTGTLRGGILDVAEAAGVLGNNISSVATSSSSVASLNSVLRGTGDLIDSLVPGINRVTTGLLDFAGAAAPGLQSIGDAVSRLLTRFGAWLSEAASSGQALVWVEQAIQAFERLADTVGDIGQLFSTILSALQPLALAMSGLFDVMSGLASVFEALPGPVQSLAVAFLLITRTGLLDFFRSAADGATRMGTTLRGEFSQIGRDYDNATGPMQAFLREQERVTGSIERMQPALSSSTGALAAANTAFNRTALEAEALGNALRTGPIVAYNRMAVASDDLVRSLNSGMIQTYNRATLAAADLGDALRTGPVQASMELANQATSTGYALRNATVDAFSNATVAASAFGQNLRTSVATGLNTTLGAAERFSTGLATTMTGAFTSAATSMANFGATLQTTAVAGFNRAAAAASGAAATIQASLGRALSGLVGTLGGPWGVAITGAVVGLGLLASSQQAASQRAAEHEAAVGELADTLNRQTGAVTNATRQLLADRAAREGWIGTANELGVSSRDFVSALSGEEAALQRVQQAMAAHVRASIASSSEYQQLSATLREAGISLDTLAAAASGNEQAMNSLEQANVRMGGSLNALISSLSSAGGPAFEQLSSALQQTNNQLGQAATSNRQAAAAMDPAAMAAQRYEDALGVLSSTTADADAKARALNDALNILAGGTVTAEIAQGRFTELLQRLNEQMASNTAGLQGMGAAMLTQEGRINTQTQAGALLISTYQQLSQGLSETAAATIEAGRANGTLDQSMIQVAQQTQAARNQFVQTAMQMGLNRQQADQLANAYGLIPAQVLTTVTDGGSAQQTELSILGVYQELKDLPPNTPVRVEGLTQEAITRLNDVGITTRTLPDGSVEVRAETQGAINSLQGLISSFSGRVINFVANIVGGNAAGGIIPQAQGGIVGYRDGGHHLRNMPANRAEIVKPNTWRVIGDRAVGDEAYIPITRSARSRSILDTTARRMGFELVPAGWGRRAQSSQPVLNVADGAIQVNAPYSDPELVAKATINELARYATN